MAFNFFNSMPWGGDNIGETSANMWQKSAQKAQQPSFFEPFKNQAGNAFSSTINQQMNASPQLYQNNLSNMWNKPINETYDKNILRMNEQFGSRGFGNSSSAVLAQMENEKQRQRDLLDANERAALTGQQLYNNQIGTLGTMANNFANYGNMADQYNNDQMNTAATTYLNMLGRKAGIDQNMAQTSLGLAQLGSNLFLKP